MDKFGSELILSTVLCWIISILLVLLKNIVVEKITDLLFEGKSKHTHQKASTSIYKIFSYSFIVFYGYLALINESWVHDPSSYINSSDSYSLPIKIKIYYLYEFTFYFLELIYLFIHYDRKDKYQMLFHHIVTILLIGGSYIKGYIRYGVVVMAIHDFGDPFLESSKLFVYLERRCLANMIFILFTIVFAVSRLIIFAYVILYSTFKHVKVAYEFDLCMFFILLSILQIMHIIWFVMIVKVAETVVEKHEVNDIRSNSEESQIKTKIK